MQFQEHFSKFTGKYNVAQVVFAKKTCFEGQEALQFFLISLHLFFKNGEWKSP